MERTGPSQGDSTDRDTLREARRGDAAAGQELVSRFGASMIRTARSVLGRYGARDGEDVVQEALLAALTTTALPTGDVGAWLRAIVVRKALDALRRRNRGREQPLPENREGAEGALLRISGTGQEEIFMVRRALAALSPRDRAVLTLVDLEGFSMAEAAEILGASGAATRWRAVRARRRLAKHLDSRDNAPGLRSEKEPGHV